MPEQQDEQVSEPVELMLDAADVPPVPATPVESPLSAPDEAPVPPVVPPAPTVAQPSPTSSAEALQYSSVAMSIGDARVPFVAKDWHGHANYSCMYCPWAYLDDELEAWLHYGQTHVMLNELGVWVQMNRRTPPDQVAAYVSEEAQ